MQRPGSRPCKRKQRLQRASLNPCNEIGTGVAIEGCQESADTLGFEVLGLQYLAIRGIPAAMSTTHKDSDYINGIPELLLLRLLARQPMHGYELVQGIRLLTGGVLTFGEGCVYPILHRLEADGLIRGTREQVGGRKRVVYHLLLAGRKRLAAATSRWEQITAAVSAALKGDGSAALALD